MPELQEIAELLRSFDEGSDPLHVDITPSVLKLIELKLDGALAVCGLLNSENRLTRMRALRVIEGAVFLHLGFRYGLGFQDAKSERHARHVLTENGYDPDAPEPQRHESADRWRRWLLSEMGKRDEL